MQSLLDEVQASLLRQAREFRDANIVDVSSYEELQAAVAEGALLGKGCCGGWQPAEGFTGWWRELLGWVVDNCAGAKPSCHPMSPPCSAPSTPCRQVGAGPLGRQR